MAATAHGATWPTDRAPRVPRSIGDIRSLGVVSKIHKHVVRPHVVTMTRDHPLGPRTDECFEHELMHASTLPAV
jgi:hypothetical protein